jgi:predicted dehydrogenase
MTKIGLALVGAGAVVWERHLPAVQALDAFEVRTVFDPDRAAAERVASAARAHVAETLEDAVRAAGVTAVTVASPNVFHRAGVEAAAAAGKHIFCEKPIATNLRDARAMLEAAERAGVLLQLGFHHRYSSEFQLARRLVQAEVIGPLRAFQAMISEPLSLVPGGADNYRLKPELSGGLTLIDFGSHRLDQLRALVGEFAEVEAQFGSVGPHRQDDNVGLLVRTRGGALGTISFHRFSRGAVSPVYLIGEKGVLCFSAFVVNPFHAAPVAVFTEDALPAELWEGTRGPDWWSPPPPGWTGFFPAKENTFINQYRAFAEAIRTGRQPEVNAEDGYRGLEIVIAAYKAFATRRPVELPLDPDQAVPPPRF